MLEERASFSPDALTAMEANLRFAGPETMETRIFGRLTAWQNWMFQRPNAVGEEGSLKRYGSGQRARTTTTRASMKELHARRNSGRLQRADPEQCRPERRSARAQGAGDLASRLHRLVAGRWDRRGSRTAWSICAPRSASDPRAGRSSATCGCRNTAGACCWRRRSRGGRSRSARTRASRRGRRCRANIAPCCAGCW